MWIANTWLPCRSTSAVFGGRQADVLLEILAKKRLVGEMQDVRDFLDAHRRCLEQCPDFKCDIMVYPFVGRAMAHLLYRFRQVFGSDAHLLGIPSYAALLREMLFDKDDEVFENRLGARALGGGEQMMVNLVAKVVDHRLEERHGEFTTETVVLVVDFLADDVEIF